MYPVHPVSHPVSHWPVTWLHVVLFLQCPEHCWLQLTPCHLSLHANEIYQFDWYVCISFFQSVLYAMIDSKTCSDIAYIWNFDLFVELLLKHFKVQKYHTYKLALTYCGEGLSYFVADLFFLCMTRNKQLCI